MMADIFIIFVAFSVLGTIVVFVRSISDPLARSVRGCTLEQARAPPLRRYWCAHGDGPWLAYGGGGSYARRRADSLFLPPRH